MKQNDIYLYDQFFTKKDIAKKCIDIVNDYCDINTFDIIIEPSAGEGSFYYLLPKKTRVGIEIDRNICNNNSEYKNISFFNYEYYEDGYNDKNILVIGNPPFGTQNKLSVDFFNHAANFSNVISFIIPKTWKNISIQNRLDKFFKLITSIDLTDDCFYGAKNTNVKCCFQIWQKTSKIRKKIKTIKKHKDWDFLRYIKKDNDIYPPKNADFVILAYGSKSGRISEDLYRWRPKSVHFIKANIKKKELIKRFEKLDYSIANDSSRQSSLCRGDLVNLYSERYEK